MAKNSQSMLSKIGELLKNIFDGENGFKKNIINPAEQSLENLTQSTENIEKNLLTNVREFIDKNVTPRIGNLKGKNLDGLEDRGVADQDLGELSQNFLDARENGDIDQMERLSKQTEEQKQGDRETNDQKVPWEGRNFGRF